MMLLLIPIAGLAVFLDFAGTSPGCQAPFNLRTAFLKTIILLSGFIALISEALSLFHALGRWEVAAGWSLAALTAVAVGIRWGLLKTGISRLSHTLKQINRFEIGLSAGMVVILGLLLLIIVKSPTNNLDSLDYHMSRVMHWAQDQSLAPYPTQFAPELNNPIWSEEAILHIRLLFGDDTVVELIQWTAMLVCMAGVSLLAGLLGAGRRGQIAAAFFSASIPMGILQATSTQNDYMTAMWVIVLLCFTLIATGETGGWVDYLWFGAILGLGMLTKATFYPYALPVLAWFAWLCFRRLGLVRAVKMALVVAGMVLILNLGFWTRNLEAFGNLFGPKDVVSSNMPAHIGPGFIAASVARNVVVNFITPSESINKQLRKALVGTFGAYDPNLAGFQFSPGWNHEDRAGSPVHFLLIPGAILLLSVARKKIRDPRAWVYLVVSLLLFVMVSVLIKIDQNGVRYQLPFIVSWAPVFGLAVESSIHPRLIQWGMAGMLVMMIPWTIYNHTRSLIALQDTHDPFTIPCSWGLGCGVRSVLVEKPATILFITFTEYRDSDLAIAKAIKEAGCKDVGLDIDSHDPEYVFWWILDAPQSGIRIETINPIPYLSRYSDLSFHPCAIICTSCSSNRTTYHGLLPQSGFYGRMLYLGNRYQVAP